MEMVWSVALAVATFFTYTSITVAVQCESYYVPFPAHDNCLYLSAANVSWDSAHVNCATFGNTLVNIDSPEAAQQLRNILAAKYPSITEIWTGLQDHWQEGEYRWSRGELLLDHGMFVSGEPNDVSRSQNCLSAKHASGSWAWRMSDRSCSGTALPHVCENWPSQKTRRGGTFTRMDNVTEANMHLMVASEVQSTLRNCRYSCLGNAFCEALAMDTAAGRCKILFFKEQSPSQRQSLLTQLATYKIYLRTGFDKYY